MTPPPLITSPTAQGLDSNGLAGSRASGLVTEISILVSVIIVGV